MTTDTNGSRFSFSLPVSHFENALIAVRRPLIVLAAIPSRFSPAAQRLAESAVKSPTQLQLAYSANSLM
ncbi:hypothetical protein [Rubripirellula obstinata]|uniref:hypothetical protein n=1 Tax=Rubripirellula obstinata TaxID=406547 RepID=UPI001F1B2E95|nr:hypothetical protein [Rubripirellula obstinata]